MKVFNTKIMPKQDKKSWKKVMNFPFFPIMFLVQIKVFYDF